MKKSKITESKEDLIVKLAKACVGGCTCLTKTPEIKFHDVGCHYRLFTEAWEEIKRLRQPKVETNYVPCDKHSGLSWTMSTNSALPKKLNVVCPICHPPVTRKKVSKEHPICEHGRNAWADDCGMCDLAGTDWAMDD